MRIPLIAIAAAAAVTLAAWPADAQNRRAGARGAEAYPGARYVQRPRAGQRTRITVRPRSFLDPGTEVLPRSQPYTDYAVPPLWHPTRIWDSTDSRRSPLPDSWEFPGYFQ
jgi:hypothetical protein